MEPVGGVAAKRSNMGESPDVPYEAGSSIEDGLKLRCICWLELCVLL